MDVLGERVRAFRVVDPATLEGGGFPAVASVGRIMLDEMNERAQGERAIVDVASIEWRCRPLGPSSPLVIKRRVPADTVMMSARGWMYPRDPR